MSAGIAKAAAASIVMVVSAVSSHAGVGLDYSRVPIQSTVHSAVRGTASFHMIAGHRLKIQGSLTGAKPGQRYSEFIRFGFPNHWTKSGFAIASQVGSVSRTIQFSDTLKNITGIPEFGWTLVVTAASSGDAGAPAVASGQVGTSAVTSEVSQFGLTPTRVVVFTVTHPSAVVWRAPVQGPENGVEVGVGRPRPIPVLRFPATKKGRREVLQQLNVYVFDRATGAVERNAYPSISLAYQGKHCSQGMTDLVPMYDARVGMADYHYSLRDWLPQGRYTVTILLSGGQRVAINDVMMG